MAEEPLEQVACPLHCVLNSAGEVLKGANSEVFLGRVAAGGVGLRQEGEHHLDVPLGPEGTAVQQGEVVVNAAAVHVHSYTDNW